MYSNPNKLSIATFILFLRGKGGTWRWERRKGDSQTAVINPSWYTKKSALNMKIFYTQIEQPFRTIY